MTDIAINQAEIRKQFTSTTSFPKKSTIFIGLSIFLTLIVISLSAATLGVVVNRLETKTISIVKSYLLEDQITSTELIKHLTELQKIADANDRRRSIATKGFNGTVAYITNQLNTYTDFNVKLQHFTVKNYIVRGTPTLRANINGVEKSYTYLANFSYMVFSAAANFDSYVRLVDIRNLGCNDTDWDGINARGAIALVKRGDCSFVDKVAITERKGAAGLLLYNDGTASDRFQATEGIRASMDSKIPAFFLSYYLGIELRNAVNAPGASVSIFMSVDVSDAVGETNICADTPTGDATKTIVIGAHSDSVPAGSGINDNGRNQ